MDQARSIRASSLLPVFLLSVSLKVLLLPAPHSTDLDVHRHWKALTLHQPLQTWYTETSTKWTLDYPPLFAFFEHILSIVLTYFHAPLTQSDAPLTSIDVSLLRLSVLILDPLLFYAIYKLCTTLHSPSASIITTLTSFLLPGLTLVDFIHFQYNVLPLSTLLLSLKSLASSNLHTGVIFFAITLNLKHTLLPLVPVIAVHILSTIHHTQISYSRKLFSLLSLAATTLTTLLIPWLPFILNDTYKSALRRMFPLHRGLLHANWAPNIWAAYATLDRVLCQFNGKCPTESTRGLINSTHPFGVLPNPTPVACVFLTLLLMFPFLISVARAPTGRSLVVGVAAAGISAFLCGWHVHEKAVLIPLLSLAVVHHEAFIWLSLGGHLALLELLRQPAIAPFLVAHFIAFHAGWFAIYGVPRGAGIYFLGCLVFEAYSGVLRGHWVLFGDWMPFLPVLVVSLYAFVGVTIAYVRMALGVFRDMEEEKNEKVE